MVQSGRRSGTNFAMDVPFVQELTVGPGRTAARKSQRRRPVVEKLLVAHRRGFWGWSSRCRVTRAVAFEMPHGRGPQVELLMLPGELLAGLDSAVRWCIADFIQPQYFTILAV